MTAKYKVIEKVNPSDLEAPRKFYPSLQTNGRVNQRTLATEAADRSSMSDADMAAALANMLALIPKHLAMGEVVDLGDFGTFRLSISTEGAATPEAVTSRNIKDVNVRFTPGTIFKEALTRIQFEKVASDKTSTG
ncbi:MAG: HU family DNA-binding protein [Chloroflexi bacterium]|nr:HU family DNA-binding protein [Chloroflexota bacterium]